MVTYATLGRPVIAYAAILAGNLSTAFVTWGIGDDTAAIIGLVLSVIFIVAILALLGVTVFQQIKPRFIDEMMFLNAADFAGIAALVGSHLWLVNGDRWTALGAFFAYLALSMGAASIWLGLRAAGRRARA